MWPRMTKSKAFKKDWHVVYHPALVYTEFISFIRGLPQVPYPPL
jgi:hypothetical protein